MSSMQTVGLSRTTFCMSSMHCSFREISTKTPRKGLILTDGHPGNAINSVRETRPTRLGCAMPGGVLVQGRCVFGSDYPMVYGWWKGELTQSQLDISHIGKHQALLL